MDSLFGNLPEELFLLIIEFAVSTFLTTDRATLVRLCQTSKPVYNRIAPALYRTVIISESNIREIEEFIHSVDTSALAARVFSYTRSLVIINCPSTKIPATLLQSIEAIQAPFTLVKDIAAEADRLDINVGIPASAKSSCALRRLHMWYAKYQSIYKLSVRARANITHICGYASNSAANKNHAAFTSNPAAYIQRILDVLPRLTHLAFDLIYLNEYETGVVHRWEVQAFGQALHAALSYQRLEVVAIRVSGRFIARWDEILRVLREVAGLDRRLQVWKDDNGAITWDEEEALIARDAALGRSIWTQVKPVQDICC